MLLASFIAPFFSATPLPDKPCCQSSQRTHATQTGVPKQIATKVTPKSQRRFAKHRQARPVAKSEMCVEPGRVIGEVTFWKIRRGAGYGFVRTDESEPEVIINSRDLVLTEEQKAEGKKIKKGCLVSFEMVFENQPRGVNIQLLSRKEAKYRQQSSNESASEETNPRQQRSNTVVAAQKADSADNGKRGSKGKFYTTSRRALSRDALLDLEEWHEEELDGRIFDNDFDDVEVVQKRRHRPKPQQNSQQRNPTNHRAFRSRTGVTATSKKKTKKKRAKPATANKWVQPKNDKHFEELYKMFERVTTTRPANQSREVVRLILQKLYDKTIVSEGLKKNIIRSTSSTPPRSCPVCLEDFPDENNCDEKEIEEKELHPVSLFNCKHSSLCLGCFQQYISIAIRDEEILPWPTCPAEKCSAPIHHGDLFTFLPSLPVSELYQFANIILYKQLSRAPSFIPCIASENKDNKCRYGFFVGTPVQKSKKCCKLCGLTQEIVPKNPEDCLDDSFKQMLKEGTLRLCPTCSHPAMKDYGMCNVMQCGKCGIYWNWSTKDTGSTYAQVKERARNTGSLWMSGELSYQLNLQQTNPQGFKDLLERNGIKYDPNFVRGRS